MQEQRSGIQQAAMLLSQAMINASLVSLCGKLPGAQRIPVLGEPRTGKKK